MAEDTSGAVLGLLAGVVGGAILAFIIDKITSPKANCPVCGTLVVKGSSNISTCPNCHTQLRWNR